MPTQNIGTLVGAAVRPLNDTMPIASAFAFEINGGHHQVATLAARNAIIVQRRQWGMLCSVYNDPTAANNATYQLKYNHYSTNTEDNQNWVVFSGGGAAGSSVGSGWVDPVLSYRTSTPASPASGDRYLVGKNSSDSLSGAFASLTNAGYSGTLVGGFIAEYSTSLGAWTTTIPSDGTTIRVNDEDNSFYRYEGTYSTGRWYKERVNQVRYFSASSSDRVNYTVTTGDYFTYSTEVVHMVQFGTSNSGSSATLNINGLGSKNIRVQSSIGLVDLAQSDIIPANVYTLIYDGTQFRINLPGSGGSSGGGFDLKYRIVSDERIYVPPYAEYLLHGDLEVNGILDISNTGKVVIINGALNINGGTVSNSGNVTLIKVPMMSEGTLNYVPKWSSTTVISATSSIQDSGSKVTLSSVLNLSPRTQPASASAGDIYFDSSTNKFRGYDGTSWYDFW
jgi:hypothetical protein